MDGYSVAKAAELTDLEPGQVSGLLHRRVILPEIHVSEGIGDSSVLGEKNIRQLKLVKRLKDTGVTAKLAFSLLDLLDNSVMNHRWWQEEGNYVVISGEKWFVTDNVLSPVNIETILKLEAVLLVKL